MTCPYYEKGKCKAVMELSSMLNPRSSILEELTENNKDSHCIPT